MIKQNINNKFQSSGLVNLNSEDFSNHIKNDAQSIIIDVRTKVEYEQGHIPNAKLIDIYLPTFTYEILELDKNKSYYLYCRSGSRSYHAGLFMIENGFTNVFNLKNGVLDWNEVLVTV